METPMISPFMDTVSKLSALKQTNTVLPIIRRQADVSCLAVGSDLALRTGVNNPVGYDRQLLDLLHRHTYFVYEDKRENMAYDEFCKTLSVPDKLSLIWALFKSTYETLGERKFKCKNENCTHAKKPFTLEVLLESIIQDDTYTVWDKDIPFYEYREVIEVPHGDVKYIFYTKMPSMNDNNRLLGTLSIPDLQKNLEDISAIYTKAQSIALITEKIVLEGENINTVETSNLQEILIALESFVPNSVGDKLTEKYNAVFDKYLPKYYIKTNCPLCGKETVMSFNLEAEFFRRSLFGSGESE